MPGELVFAHNNQISKPTNGDQFDEASMEHSSNEADDMSWDTYMKFCEQQDIEAKVQNAESCDDTPQQPSSTLEKGRNNSNR